jgi:hypothetical protein
METGSTITGGTNSNEFSDGGGVYVIGGEFTMSGGAISENTGQHGGGVYVAEYTFIYNAGTISDNTAEDPTHSSYAVYKDTFGTINLGSLLLEGNYQAGFQFFPPAL